MSDLNLITNFGSNLSQKSRKGADIILKENKVYLANETRTVLLFYTSNENFGEGRFSSEDYPNTNTKIDIERRGTSVFFKWSEGGIVKKKKVPCLKDVSEKIIDSFEKYYSEKNSIPLTSKIFSLIDSNINVVKFRTEKEGVRIIQKSPEGSYSIENLIPQASKTVLDFGKKEDIKTDSKEITIATSEFSALSLLLTYDNFSVNINEENLPLSIKIPLKTGTAKILISPMLYEEEKSSVEVEEIIERKEPTEEELGEEELKEVEEIEEKKKKLIFKNGKFVVE